MQDTQSKRVRFTSPVRTPGNRPKKFRCASPRRDHALAAGIPPCHPPSISTSHGTCTDNPNTPNATPHRARTLICSRTGDPRRSTQEDIRVCIKRRKRREQGDALERWKLKPHGLDYRCAIAHRNRDRTAVCRPARPGTLGLLVLNPRHSHCSCRRHTGDYGSEHSTELTGRRTAPGARLFGTRPFPDPSLTTECRHTDRPLLGSCPRRHSRGLSATAPVTKDTGRPFEPSRDRSARPRLGPRRQAPPVRAEAQHFSYFCRFRTDTERSVPPRLLPPTYPGPRSVDAPRRPPSQPLEGEARRFQRRQLPRRAQRCGPGVLQANSTIGMLAAPGVQRPSAWPRPPAPATPPDAWSLDTAARADRHNVLLVPAAARRASASQESSARPESFGGWLRQEVKVGPPDPAPPPSRIRRAPPSNSTSALIGLAHVKARLGHRSPAVRPPARPHPRTAAAPPRTPRSSRRGNPDPRAPRSTTRPPDPGPGSNSDRYIEKRIDELPDRVDPGQLAQTHDVGPRVKPDRGHRIRLPTHGPAS